MVGKSKTAHTLLRRSTTLTVVVAAVLSNAAQAQQAATPSTSVLEEVLVTAERREVSLQDTPASATVLTADAIAAQGIDNVSEIQQVAPSVAINTYNRSTFINIRGVGISQSAPTSNPGVAYYIDGVFIPHEQFIAQSFFDFESIEVLRGPQGTLTGQNSTGGAIYVRTPTPDFDEFSGYIDQTIGDYDWYRTVAALNIPVTDTLAVRVSGVYDDRGGFTDNIGPSSAEPGSGTDQAVRAAVRYQPVEGATFDLRYEYFKRETDNNAVKNRADLVTRDPFTIEEDALSFLDQDGYRASLEGRFDLPADTQLRVLTSYFDAETTDQADGDRTATAPAVPANLPTSGANTTIYPGRIGFTHQELETFVTEVNFLSRGEGALQWVVGGFYMDETSPVQVYRDNRSTVTYTQSNSTIDTELTNESISAFGQVDYRFNDRWAVDVGLRQSKDKQEYTRFVIPGPPPPGCFPCTTDVESDETTGRVGVKYFANDDVMMYGTVSRGYKAGGINLDPRLPNYDPETNEVAELGIKSTVADGRLRINGAVFYSEYDGIQLSALVPLGTTFIPNTLNAAPAEIYGAELELTGQFGGLGFNLGLSALQSEFTEDAMLTDSQTNTNRLVPEGSIVPFAPEMTANAGIQYEFLIGNMTLTPRVQVSYLDEQLATPFRYQATTVPSRTITDLRVTLVPMDNLRLEAFATNVFDKEYISAQLQDASSARGGMLYGAPRQYGVRAKFDF
ncbi:TonB-dependent receptor [Steroidobacter agaridevorans]|uniref:TonB-dependent receptor n=1 Tax=Steroidobacter agaridevorans TaxID=2695856 RepID=A0A829YGF0_9GAMM|nr:TonB-dependent receptor [Steroidobacter agaridevorans]GFE82290.1 TonB-dependent receptor [Steroidobacter agaridevorans]